MINSTPEKGELPSVFEQAKAVADGYIEDIAQALSDEFGLDGYLDSRGEYRARNPGRSDGSVDKNPGSFSININTGRWNDFGDAGSTGGDVVSYVAHILGVNNYNAADWILEFVTKLNGGILPKIGARQTKPKTLAIIPVPDEVPYPSHLTQDNSPHWEYRTETGGRKCIVVRKDILNKDTAEVDKTYITWFYGVAEGETTPRWLQSGLNNKGPFIYNLDKAAANEDALLIITEGEKCADALNDALQNLNLTSAIAIAAKGGASNGHNIDWSPIANRKVVIWPDADSAGEKYCATVTKILSGLRCVVNIVDVDALARTSLTGEITKKNIKEGWDCADALLEWADHKALINTMILNTHCVTAVDASNTTQEVTNNSSENLDAKQPASFMDPWEDAYAYAFPMDTLAPGLRGFVDYTSRSLGCTASAVAMCALSATTAAISQQAGIRMTQHANWVSKVRLWLMLVGAPSTMKSPLLAAAFGPLEKIDADNYAAAKLSHDLWVQAKAQAKTNNQQFTTPEPAEPTRLIVRDVTSEVVAGILSRSPRGSNILRDELSGWLGSMDRYSSKSGGDRAFYLQCFNGGNYTKDRVGKGQKWGDGSIFIENCSLNVNGGIQPNKLREMTDLQGDGLLQRFQAALMDVAGDGEDIPDYSAAFEYAEAIRVIHAYEPMAFFTFDQAAQLVCNRVQKFIKDLQRTDAFGDGFSQWAGKLGVLYGTLCVTLHITDAAFAYVRAKAENEKLPVSKRTQVFFSPALTIPVDVAERAERIIHKYTVPTGVTLYTQIIGGQVGEITRAAASYILTSHNQRFVASDFAKNVRAMRGMDAWTVNKHISILVTGGWLHEEPTRGRHPTSWTVAPSIRETLKARAEQEAARKEDIKKLIGEAADLTRAATKPAKLQS